MIRRVLEKDSRIIEYLEKRGLLERYQKAKARVISGDLSAVDFKKRKPKTSDMYQFRITDKYRAFCYLDESDVVVFEINDHQ